MSLPGAQYKALCDAIVSAFPSWGELDRAVTNVTKTRLNLITREQPMPDVAFELVRWAKSRGLLDSLTRGLHAQNPGNPHLAAYVARYLDPAATTPDTTETTMPTTDLSTRAIHIDHRTGVVHLIREALALKGDDATEGARRILARCFAEDMTYAELPNLGERAVTRAIDRVLPDADIPETRVDELIAAVRTITPDRRVCPKCGRLDLRRVAARWSPVASDYCPADEGVYARVAFPADVIAWTTGCAYPPGTTHDDDRLPITDAAIRAWVTTSGGTLHAWTEDATRDEGVALTDLANYLLRTGQTPNALATLDALAYPRRAHLAMDADAMHVLVRRVKSATAAPPNPPPGTVRAVDGVWDKDHRKALREVLCELYPSPSTATIVSDVGIRRNDVHLVGAARDVWFNIIEQASRQGLLDALYQHARREYPRNPALIALG